MKYKTFLGGDSPVPDTCGYVDVKMKYAVPPDDLSLGKRLRWVIQIINKQNNIKHFL